MSTLLTYSGFVAVFLHVWNIDGIAKLRPAFRSIRLRCHLASFAVILMLAFRIADMFRNVPWWLTGLSIAFMVAMLYLWRRSLVLIGHLERLQRR